jgi:hypothetical protein
MNETYFDLISLLKNPIVRYNRIFPVQFYCGLKL